MESTTHPEVWKVLDKRVPKKLEANYRKDGDFLIVLNTCFKGAGIIALNDTATAIYLACDGKNTIADITESVRREYPDIPGEKLVRDVHTCIRDLELKRLVTVVDDKYVDKPVTYLHR